MEYEQLSNQLWSSIMRACETMARTNHGDDGNQSKSREPGQVEQSTYLLNSEPPPTVDMMEEDTTSVTTLRVSVSSEAPPDVMIETHDDINGLVDEPVTPAKQLSTLLDVSNNDKAYLAKSVSFVASGACRTVASSVRKKYPDARNKLDSSIISAKSSQEQSFDGQTFNGTQETCTDNALELNVVEVGQVSLHIAGTLNTELSSDDVCVAPAEQLQDFEATTTVENQTRVVDNNVRSIGVKRKPSQDKASSRPS